MYGEILSPHSEQFALFSTFTFMPSARALKIAVFPFLFVFVILIGFFRENLGRVTKQFIPSGYDASMKAVPYVPSRPYYNPIGPSEEYAAGVSSFPPHAYYPNGLLEVNSQTPHPIYDLLLAAEKRWQSKLNGASTSLEEAVTEYKRRYHRAPPKGFDAWWQYVTLHNVQLPDEYDQIWKDLEPFWGYRPADLRRLQNEQESHSDSFTLGKGLDEEIQLVNVSFNDWTNPNILRGAQDLIDLLKEVEENIPPFRAVFSPHDNPRLLSDYDIKQMALDAAAAGTFVDIANLPATDYAGWLSACPPLSPARQPDAGAISNTSNKSFIHDHRQTMDPCLHPQLLGIHGEFLPYGSGPAAEKLLVPQFSPCSTTLHHDIQFPSMLSWVEDIFPRSDDPEWEGKVDERLSWRGSNTGMWNAPETRWQEAQRPRLVTYANELNGTTRVLVSPSERKVPIGTGVTISKSKINPAMMDVAFAGTPLQCPPEYCDEIGKMFEWRKRQSFKESGNFKYIVDVDGNAWSSRFKRLMTSNSLIFKATIYPEWFLDRIEPWVHYVPVQVDLSDLYDTLVFFRGGMYGEGAHDDDARKIARAGREWSKTFWRREDIIAYMFRLMLEYSRVMSLDRDGMTYTL